ncbi:AAA family ATPase [Pseudoruegeria sp. HB172150]|uniref:AAA family ATPase n=1 Tax=Pseudoruegeria sp. HB172150 TaxID=2721164 RepID=UPI001C12E55A|nr:AAA family ATPase [Pseudoruegeria sp. HB172150]
MLHQIVKHWISPSEEGDHGFVEKPNLSQLVVVSYSPFERFPVDLAGRELQDKESYRYFGLRGRTKPSDAKKLGRITLSHYFPKRNAARSLVQCLADDQRLRSIRDWSRKVATMESVLRTAMAFDFAAVEVGPRKRRESFYHDVEDIDPLAVDVGDGEDRRRYIPIASDRVVELDNERLSATLEATSGVTFFLDGQPIELSSGQRLFAYIVINILGAIRRNSLILVDEPELFLHPTLEIQFVEMLKMILSRFNSKALLATHSVVTVREVPSHCVHVFENTEDDIILRHPPFQTFGGDFQRISSYVFGDKSVSKPFEDWIRAQLEELGSAEALITELGDQINEELIVQIKATERGQW